MFVPVPTPEEMARWDAASISFGFSEETLMERASLAAMDCLRIAASAKGISLSGSSVLLLAGGGNNGGDAFCMARHLLEARAKPVLLCTRSRESYRAAAALWLDIAVRLGIPVFSADEWNKEHPAIPLFPDIVVDGLLGTGFQGPLRAKESLLIEKLNALHAGLVISIDIPSGLDACTGRPSPVAVHADVTVSFQAAKPGLLLPEARIYTGSLDIRPIGIPRSIQEKYPPSFRTWLCPVPRKKDRGEAYGIDPDMPHEACCNSSIPSSWGPAHKGAAGKVIVIGGSPEYTGAPCLSALAALRAGAGLVALAGPEEVLNAARISMPALVTRSISGKKAESSWCADAAYSLADILPSFGAIVFGPGLGRGQGSCDFARALLSLPHRPPMVLDADALFALAQNPELFSHLRPCDILTPHPGEAATLLKTETAAVQQDRFAALHHLAELAPAVWILKGEGTLISSPQMPSVISPWSVPQLAVAGSGDVLAGIIGTMLCHKHTADLAATLGVWIHALAGRALAHDFPCRGNTPLDIANILPRILKLAGEPHGEELCPSF
ncbi:MAG: NAD(P)H-hydrate dehydratase [Mailhella sp.]